MKTLHAAFISNPSVLFRETPSTPETPSGQTPNTAETNTSDFASKYELNRLKTTVMPTEQTPVTDPEKEMKKAEVKKEMAEVAEKLGIKFYVGGKETPLAEIDLDSKCKWYFSNAYQNKESVSDNAQIAKFLKEYYNGESIMGLFQHESVPFGWGADAGEEAWYLENFDAKKFFSELPFVEEVYNWYDGDTHPPFYKDYYFELIEEGKSLENPKQLKDFLFEKLLLPFEGIEEAINKHPEHSMTIIYGNNTVFPTSLSTLQDESSIICVPKEAKPTDVPEPFRELHDHNLSRQSDFMQKLNDFAKNFDMQEYQTWRKNWVEKNGEPFEKE